MNVHMYMYMYVHVGIQCSYIYMYVYAPNLVLVISYYYGLRLQKNVVILWNDVKIASYTHDIRE